MPIGIRGDKGRIDWGYFAAAAIYGFSIARNKDGGYTLTGTVVSLDSYKVSQRNLVFAAVLNDREWRWPVKSIDIAEGNGPRAFVATLGAQLPEMITR
jgi:hypothetical protein